MKPVVEHPSGGRLYSGKGTGMFGVLGPYDKNPATIGNGTMGGFRFDTAEEATAFHAKALELGAVNEGDPGERVPKAFFAYFAISMATNSAPTSSASAFSSIARSRN